MKPWSQIPVGGLSQLLPGWLCHGELACMDVWGGGREFEQVWAFPGGEEGRTETGRGGRAAPIPTKVKRIFTQGIPSGLKIWILIISDSELSRTGNTKWRGSKR